MSRALLIAVFFFFGCFPDRATGQTTGSRNQTLTNKQNHQEPLSAPRPSSVTSSDVAAEAKKFYLEGLKLADADQFPEAAENFRQAIKLDSEYVDAYSELGRMYFKMRDWQNAVINLRRAVELRKKQRETRPPLPLQPPKPAGGELGTSEKTNFKAPQTTLAKDKNANTAVVKTVQPPPTTAPAERRQDKGVAQKPQPKLEVKQPAANANTADAKTTQLQSQSLSANPSTPIKQPVANAPAEQRQDKGVAQKPQPKLELKQPAPNATSAAVKTAQLQSPSLSANPSTPIKQPVPNANSADVKTTQLQSQSLSANPSTPIKQPVANASDAGVKSVLRQPEGTPDPKQPNAKATDQPRDAVGERASMQLTPLSQPLEAMSPASAAAINDDLSLMKIYRVGPGDILDVRLNDSDSARSTLFTVTPSGLLEHPVLNEPLTVTGLTVEEIDTKIENELKARALIENPKVEVSVRDYVSHSILVSGLVKESGTKFLRREAVPLYVVVADAQPVPEAARVTLIRNEQHKIYEIDLTQAADMNLLVRQGDVITLQPNTTQFVYIGGEIKNPGEKTFRRGLRLTQLIIAAGGLTTKGRVASIDRDKGQGFLVGSQFNLKDIESGKAADPLLNPGDRVMILR
jgi:protein involved in polysaccharide export with SLBB domain